MRKVELSWDILHALVKQLTAPFKGLLNQRLPIQVEHIEGEYANLHLNRAGRNILSVRQCCFKSRDTLRLRVLRI